MKHPLDQLESLPGWELVGPGLRDLRAGRISKEAILVLIASPRLRHQGFEIQIPDGVQKPYEHALYSMLEEERGDGAYSYYNSLLRRLVSFENAIESR